MLLPHNREMQKEKYIVVKKLKKREYKAMTKQIKNKNIFSLMRKKNYIWIICMTIKNYCIVHIQWRKQETVPMENFREITAE